MEKSLQITSGDFRIVRNTEKKSSTYTQDASENHLFREIDG